MRRDQARVHIAGMARRVAKPRDTRQIGESLQQSSKRPGRTIGSLAVIRIDVLADERDFAHSGLGQ
jgi:hypothetical protein